MSTTNEILAQKYAETLKDTYDGIMAGTVSYGDDANPEIEKYHDAVFDEDASDNMAPWERIMQNGLPHSVQCIFDEIMSDDNELEASDDVGLEL